MRNGFVVGLSRVVRTRVQFWPDLTRFHREEKNHPWTYQWSHRWNQWWRSKLYLGLIFDENTLAGVPGKYQSENWKLTDVYSEQFQIQHDENNSANQILLTSSISMLFRRGMTSWWRHITDIPQGPRSYFIQMTWFISEFIDGVNINLITWWLRPITWPQLQVQHFRLEWHAKQIHTGATYKHPLILIHEFNFLRFKKCSKYIYSKCPIYVRYTHGLYIIKYGDAIRGL